MLFKRIAAFLLALLLCFSPMCMRAAYAVDGHSATPTDMYEELVEFDDDDWGSIDPAMFERKIYIEMAQNPVYYGDEVTLIAILVDFHPEDNPVFEWQYSIDCEEWETIADENHQTYTFTITPENAGWYYRVVVKI